MSHLISRRVSRRRLLQGAAAAAAVAAAEGCGSTAPVAQPAADTEASAFGPLPPSMPPMNCKILAFFTAAEAEAVEAATARLVPGSKRDPGAREACVTNYIDHKLAEFQAYSVPTYSRPPFAKPSKRNLGQQPHAGSVIYVDSDQLPRFGFQSDLTPQEAYRAGLKALDSWSRGRFNKRFVDLDPGRQDSILTDLEKGRAMTFEAPGPAAFFSMLRTDTIEGMFSDPSYGGNRDLVGWKLLDYPGAQRGYTAGEMRKGGRRRRPQALDQMPAMNPGRPDPDAILPIAGSDRSQG